MAISRSDLWPLSRMLLIAFNDVQFIFRGSVASFAVSSPINVVMHLFCTSRTGTSDRTWPCMVAVLLGICDIALCLARRMLYVISHS